MRVALYARYSSENQSRTSIKDQIELCSRYVDKQGWTIVATYTDPAGSGASRFRPGYQRLLSDLDRSIFDIVVVEALDRLGRKLSDIADLHDRCAFAASAFMPFTSARSVRCILASSAPWPSSICPICVRRPGAASLAKRCKGKPPGGKAYGYNVVAPSTGERRINALEARIVGRIFREFADGASPRAIAKRLNLESIAGPEGRPWGGTTIRGQADRGTGILNNALYAGCLEWNRCSYIKDPRIGKRVARPNPRSKWEIVEIPDLRIVDDNLWARVRHGDRR